MMPELIRAGLGVVVGVGVPLSVFAVCDFVDAVLARRAGADEVER